MVSQYISLKFCTYTVYMFENMFRNFCFVLLRIGHARVPTSFWRTTDRSNTVIIQLRRLDAGLSLTPFFRLRWRRSFRRVRSLSVDVRSLAFHAIRRCAFPYRGCRPSARTPIVFVGGTPLICTPRHGIYSICDIDESHKQLMLSFFFQFGIVTVMW